MRSELEVTIGQGRLVVADLELDIASALTHGTITGRLVDDRNRPLAGIKLGLYQGSTKVYESLTNGSGSFQFPNVPGNTDFMLRIPAVARNNGYLDFKHVPARFDLLDQLQQIGIEFGPSAGTIRLKRVEQPTLFVVVNDILGRPVAGASVRGRDVAWRTQTVEVVTDEKGAAHFSYLAAGDWEFTVRHERRGFSTRRFQRKILPPGTVAQIDGQPTLLFPNRLTVRMSDRMSENCQNQALGEQAEISFACIGPLNEFGQTVLIIAAALGKTGMVQTILAGSSDPTLVNEEDHLGFTALHYAVRAGHYEAAQLLLRFGADPYAKGGAGLTALDIGEQSSSSLRDLLRTVPQPTQFQENPTATKVQSR